jgi:hypothetical protein
MNPVVEDDNSLDQNFITPHLRDFKLAIEFKHLMKHAPGISFFFNYDYFIYFILTQL